MARKIKEASLEDQKELKSVTHNLSDPVVVRNKTYHVRWMHPYLNDRVTMLMQQEGNDNTILCKCAALIILGSFWKTRFFYWFVWRWFYYIKQYNALELNPLFTLAQKKTVQVEAEAFLNDMILLTALTDAKKQMTKAEAERILQELRGGKDGKSPRNTPG